MPVENWVFTASSDVWAYVSGPLWEAKEWLIPAIVAQGGATIDALGWAGVADWLDARFPRSKGLRVRFAQSIALFALFMAGFLAWNGERSVSQEANDGRRRAEGRASDLARELSAVSAENASLRARPTQEQAQGTERALASANSEIAVLRQRVAQLEARAAPRVLTAEQKARLLGALQPWRAQYRVEFSYQSGSDEVANYSNDLLSVFAGLGWTREPPSGVSVKANASAIGLSVAYRDEDQAGAIFATALRDLGIPFARIPWVVNPSEIKIHVSSRTE